MSISDVFAQYERIREENAAEESRRRAQVYSKLPDIKSIHQKINELQKKRILSAFSSAGYETQEILDLRKSVSAILASGGFPTDYLDSIYSCHLCHDTGLRTDGTRCDCFKKKALEDKLYEARLKDDGISFESFNEQVFDDVPIESGKSQKDIMQKIKNSSSSFAESFPDCPNIFLMSGNTGLGKTFIAKCVMRRIIERGFTAAFYTSYRLFSLFHRDRLGENVDLSPVFEVPLLVIDDLGSEPMTHNVTTEYFFDLLNERSGLHTLIVTNLPFHEIKDRYGERIHSRLMDNSTKKIIFKGKDIRYS